MNKVIVLAVLRGCLQTAESEEIVPEWDVTTVTFTVHWYESRMALQYALKVKGNCRNCGNTRGISLCKPQDDGTVHCTIMAVRPVKVDDKHTKILGHEVLHGLLGRYHEEDY